MNTLHQIFSHYFALPFAIALIPSGRRLLAHIAVVLVPLTIWVNAGESTHPSVVLMLMASIVGLLAGNRARAVITALPGKKRSAAMVAMGSIAALVLLPGSMAAEVEELAHSTREHLRQWETRPPSESCFAGKYSVSIAGATYYVPAAPVIAIRAGKDAYHFQFNSELRKICVRAKSSNEPIHAENLNLDFSIPMHGAFCRLTRSGWGQETCGQGAQAVLGAYPAMAILYSPAEYDRNHVLDSHSYADFVSSRDKAIAAQHPLASTLDGIFERYANGYWVARGGTWKNDDGEPFTLQCQESATAGTLSCATSYRLKTGPQVYYRFNAPANKVEAYARRIDENFHSMITELSAS